MIFVFGSNEAGIHGAGAARHAHKHKGAVWGKGLGHHGDSFAIPTKDKTISSLPLSDINTYVLLFLAYARANPQLEFQVTAIGCGLAGFEAWQIAPLFIGGQPNIYYDTSWRDYLTDDSKFWGTHP